MSRLLQLGDTPPEPVQPVATPVPDRPDLYVWQPIATVDPDRFQPTRGGQLCELWRPITSADIYPAVPERQQNRGWAARHGWGKHYTNCMFTDGAADPRSNGWWGSWYKWELVVGATHWRLTTSPRLILPPTRDMKLWRISQTVNNRHDTYNEAIVAAPNLITARHIHPCWEGHLIAVEPGTGIPVGYYKNADGSRGKRIGYRYTDAWAEPDNVTTRLIGQAEPGQQIAVICTSFNAG